MSNLHHVQLLPSQNLGFTYPAPRLGIWIPLINCADEPNEPNSKRCQKRVNPPIDPLSVNSGPFCDVMIRPTQRLDWIFFNFMVLVRWVYLAGLSWRMVLRRSKWKWKWKSISEKGKLIIYWNLEPWNIWTQYWVDPASGSQLDLSDWLG